MKEQVQIGMMNYSIALVCIDDGWMMNEMRIGESYNEEGRLTSSFDQVEWI